MDSWVRVTIPGEPVPKARPRVVNGRTYTPERTKTAEHAIGWALRSALGPKGVDGEREFSVHAVFRTSTKRRCDLDNLLKTVLDAGNGVVWSDDSQVVEARCRIVRGCPDASTYIAISEEPRA